MKNQKVLITGASSGIGLAIAKKLTDLDAQVVNLSRSAGQLEKLEAKNGTLETIECDISDAKSVSAAINGLQQKGWTPDVLINNARSAARLLGSIFGRHS